MVSTSGIAVSIDIIVSAYRKLFCYFCYRRQYLLILSQPRGSMPRWFVRGQLTEGVCITTRPVTELQRNRIGSRRSRARLPRRRRGWSSPLSFNGPLKQMNNKTFFSSSNCNFPSIIVRKSFTAGNSFFESRHHFFGHPPLLSPLRGKTRPGLLLRRAT